MVWKNREKDQPPQPAPVRKAIVRNLAKVEPEVVRWLWPGRIPLGKLTLLAGDPGVGKSFVTLDIAACVSTGRHWPDCENALPAAGVALFSAEDGLADTIRPRLDKALADASKIIAVEGVEWVDPEIAQQRARSFNLSEDLPRLEEVLQAHAGIRLVVIDPISAYCGEKVDSHKNAEVRSMLAPLAALAEKFGVAVLAVTHLAKGAGGKAIYRAMGSLAFGAAARAVWFIGKDQNDDKRRLLLPVKMNLAAEMAGLAYALVEGAVAWERNPVEMTADDLLAVEVARPEGDSADRQAAAQWLVKLLAEEDVPAALVFKEAADCGFSKATIKRAKKIAGVRVYNEGFGKKKAWFWTTAETGSRRRRSPAGKESEPLSEPLSENPRNSADDGLEAHPSEVSTYDQIDGDAELGDAGAAESGNAWEEV
jgi:hypothetical protein